MERTTAKNQFYTKLITLAIPIVLQSLVTSSLNLVDNLMIGQLGEVSIAAVGLGNQVYFLANLFMLGVSGGTSIFFAQYWGKQDLRNIHKTMGLGLILTFSLGAIFTAAASIFPAFVIGIYSKDPLVIAEGAKYLQIAALSYIPYSISCVYITALRSTGQVRIPLYTSIIALGLNTLLNYILIFGNFGAPAMGVQGAAIATLSARCMELIMVLAFVYGGRMAVGAKLKSLFSFTFDFFKMIMKKITFVMLNEGVWAVGTTCYAIIYARISTEATAAMNIGGTFFNILFIFAIGIGSAIAILIGNSLGANEFEQAKEYAKKGLMASFVCGVIVSIGVFFVRDGILSLYNIQPHVYDYARSVTNWMMIILPLNCVEFTLFIGILRAGGDTKFCTAVDIGALWLVGLPLAFAGAFIFKLSLIFVYLLARTESLTRSIICYRRFKSNKWINNVTEET